MKYNANYQLDEYAGGWVCKCGNCGEIGRDRCKRCDRKIQSKKITILLNGNLYNRLKTEAKRRGLRMAPMLRKIIFDYKRKNHEKTK